MDKSIRAAWLMTIALLAGAAGLFGPGPEAIAAKKQEAPKINPKILKPLQAALELTNAEKFADAEVELAKADSVGDKSPFEQFQIDELAGFVALKQRKFNAAAAAYERGLESGLLPEEQVSDRLRLLTQVFLQTDPRNLEKSGEYGKRWLEATGTRDPVMLGMVGQSAYFGERFSEAANYMKEAVSLRKAAGEKPEENWLLILQSSYSKLKNNPGIIEATTDLARYFPSKDHWVTLLQAELAAAANKEGRILQVFRLMYQADAMAQADDFTEAATVAIRRGSPGEAVQFIEKGYATGVLESSGDKARSQTLRDDAKRQAEADKKSLDQFEKEALAAKAGEADVRLGEAFLSYDQPAKGLEAIRRGIDKGGVKDADEASLSLGRAYVLNGNAADAVKAFETVKNPEFAQLAQLWSIYAGQL